MLSVIHCYRYSAEVKIKLLIECVLSQVLPPLKDVKERPEIGCTVRNKLVRLMTHIDMAVKQGAAEFLFVLCKESGESSAFLMSEIVCF